MRARALLRKAIKKYWTGQGNAQYHFIHIPKNAGQSVREALYLQPDVSLSEPFHYRYVDIADVVGRNLKFFAVVRNPWSRTASRFHFGKQNAGRWTKDDPRRQFIATATFSDFVKQQRILPIPEHPDQPWMGPLSSWLDQLEWLRDDKGNVACDCLRLESLDQDLSSYLRRKIALRRANVTRAAYDYRSMYTTELTDIVADLFRRDIDHFGFEFDGPATRNIFASR
jgi:hypothetical protein